MSETSAFPVESNECALLTAISTMCRQVLSSLQISHEMYLNATAKSHGYHSTPTAPHSNRRALRCGVTISTHLDENDTAVDDGYCGSFGCFGQ